MSKRLTIRDWEPSDMDKLRAMHERMAVGYPLPDFNPLFFVRKAVVDENGSVVAMATVKLVGEAYVWTDEISALTKAKSIRMLNEACAAEASKAGLSEVSAWIPARIAWCFRKALRKLGWQKSRWRSWSIALK